MFSQHSDCGCFYQANKFKAYKYSTNGTPDSALYYFKTAFSTGHAALNDLLMAADRALLLDSLAIAKHFILNAFCHGLNTQGYEQFLKWSGRGKINNSEWIPNDTIAQIVARYQHQLNQGLVDQLKKLERNDQYLRDEEQIPSPERLSLQDSINAAELKRIVIELGHLPGYTEVGSNGVDILELLFLHMNPENLGWFLPYIIQQIHNCEYFDTDGLAYQIDRIAVSSGLALYVDEAYSLSYDTIMPVFLNKQYFSVTGYWYDTSPFDGANYFWPVFSSMQEGQLKTTRERLCLDSYEHYIQRNPRIKLVPVSELVKLFGR